MVTVPRSALALAALATSAVPGLDAVATCEPQRVTADMQMTGVLDASGRRWTVRCPLHPAASAQFEGELALLAALDREVEAGHLPFEVPRCAGTLTLPEGGRLMVSPLLRGRTLDLDELHPGPGLSASLGSALAALHELDPDIIADVGLPVYTADSFRRRCLAEVDEAARTGRVPSVLLNRWERALEDVTLWRFRATPVHADLAADQVLVADGRVTAIVSFTEAHVGDPAQDLAWLMASAPEDALDALVEAYVMGRKESADSALLDRAMLTSELALARWLLHGVRTRDDAIVEDATGMLDELAEDVLNAPPIGYHEPTVVLAPVEEPEDDESDPILGEKTMTIPVTPRAESDAPDANDASGPPDSTEDGGAPADGADGADGEALAEPEGVEAHGSTAVRRAMPVTEPFDMDTLGREARG